MLEGELGLTELRGDWKPLVRTRVDTTVLLRLAGDTVDLLLLRRRPSVSCETPCHSLQTHSSGRVSLIDWI